MKDPARALGFTPRTLCDHHRLDPRGAWRSWGQTGAQQGQSK